MRYPVRLNQEIKVPIYVSNSLYKQYLINVAVGGMTDRRKDLLSVVEVEKLVVKKVNQVDIFKCLSTENIARYLALKILRLNREGIHEVAVTVYEAENSCATVVVQNPEID